jgi:hypothetical protein
MVIGHKNSDVFEFLAEGSKRGEHALSEEAISEGETGLLYD